MAGREPKTLIRVPTHELLLSLFQQLLWVPGEKGTAVDAPDLFLVELVEFPTDGSDLEDLLASVQAWLDESDVESVTVQAEQHAYELRRSEV